MGILAWIVFGALAGWLANVVVGGRSRERLGCLVSIAVGIVGAALGGLLYQVFTGERKTFEFDLPSFAVAALGAVILLSLLRLVQGAATKRRRGHRS